MRDENHHHGSRLPARVPTTNQARPPATVAIYARVSTLDQEPENQLAELRRYAAARGWTVAGEYFDRGVSGSQERRPALDRLTADARRRRFDVVLCWRLDRLGRKLRHLITLLEELQTVGVAFVSLAEGIDATTPAGRLQMLCAVDKHVALCRTGRAYCGGPLRAGHITWSQRREPGEQGLVIPPRSRTWGCC